MFGQAPHVALKEYTYFSQAFHFNHCFLYSLECPENMNTKNICIALGSYDYEVIKCNPEDKGIWIHDYYKGCHLG